MSIPHHRSLPFLAVALALMAAAALALAAPGAAAGIPIHGRAEDDGRRPIAGAAVRLHPEVTAHRAAELHLAGAYPPPPLVEVHTGADGGFTLEAPHAGFWRLVVDAAGRAPRELLLAPLVEDVWLPAASLPAETRVEVRVGGPDGRPLAGAFVLALAPSQPAMNPTWRAPDARLLSDAEGKAHVRAAADARPDVWVAAPGLTVGVAKSAAGTVRLALPAGTRRALQVTAPGGGTAAGVVVTTDRGLPLGRTGPGGRLALPLRAGESLALRLEATDGSLAQLTAEPLPPGAEALPLRVQLRPTARFSGRVIDAVSRRPVPGALVWLAESPARSVTTDARGGYVLDGAAGAGAALHAAAPGYFLVRAAASAVAASPTLALEPAAVVAGLVVDPAGRPVAGVEVTAAPAESMAMRRPRFGFPEPRARSDARGHFRLAPLDPLQRYQLTFRHARYATLEREAGVSLELQPPLRVTLEPGAGARGVVVDRNGAPIAGASVKLRREPEPGAGGRTIRFGRSEEIPAAEATSERDGRFTFGRLASGRYTLSASAPGFAAATLPGVAVPPGVAAVGLGEIELEEGVAITGRVVDEAGTPLVGAEVFVLTSDAARVPMLHWALSGTKPDTLTAGDGFFVLADRRPGERLDVAARRSGYTAARLAGVVVPVAEPLTLTLRAASAISGRVVDERGEPVAEARIHVIIERSSAGMMASSSSYAVSGSDGRYRVEDLEPGVVRVNAAADGYLPATRASVEVPAGRDVTDLELVLRPGAVVEGVVTGGDGEPAIGAAVRVVAEGAGGGGMSIGVSRVESDGDGRYRLAGVEPGRRSVEARHDRWQRAVAELEVTPGDQRLDLRLGAGQPVSGRVVAEDGRPVAGAAVRLVVPQATWGPYTQTTDEAGIFAVPNVPDGTYEVIAEHRDHSPARVPVTVAGAPVADLVVELGAGQAITGMLRGLSPAELAQASVAAHGGGDRLSRQGSLSHDGRYRVAGLGPGTWTVTAGVTGAGRRASDQVELAPGQPEALLDLDFSGGVTLSGVVSHAGRPLDGARVWVAGTDVQSFGDTVTDQQGRYRVENLEPGTHRFEVSDMQRGLRQRGTVTIEGDHELDVELRSARLAGRVVDATTDEPLDGARVSLTPTAEDDSSPFRFMGGGTTTDDGGRFLLTAVGEGNWRVGAEKVGFAPGEVVVELTGGEAEEVALRLQPTQGVTLRVTRPVGSPPEWIHVAVLDAAGRSLTGGNFTTGEGGVVRIGTVPAGTWELLVRGQDTAVARLTAQSPGPPVAVVLDRQATLEVVVPEAAEDPAILEVTARGADGRLLQVPWGSVLTSEFRAAHGRVVLQALPAGTWTVEAVAPDGRRWRGTAATQPGVAARIELR